MDGFLVELSHENDSCRGPTFSVHTYRPSLWPLGKVLNSHGSSAGGEGEGQTFKEVKYLVKSCFALQTT